MLYRGQTNLSSEITGYDSRLINKALRSHILGKILIGTKVEYLIRELEGSPMLLGSPNIVTG